MFTRSEDQRETIEALKRRKIVVLSPHFDDACFSLGAILQAVGHGTVVNVFTRSLFLAGVPRSSVNEATVRRIRDNEDAEFARFCGLDRIDLGCSEPAIENRRSFDLTHLEKDVDRATPVLLAALDALSSTSKGTLFCPLGIGGHANHMAVFETVARNIDRIQGSFGLAFYEDQPYAANPFRRLAGLTRFRRAIKGSAFRRTSIATMWRQKKRLVDFYPSQFRRMPVGLRFRPGALLPLGIHEAFWTAE